MDTHQFAALAGAVVPRLPRSLDPALAQRWIDAPVALEVALAQALSTFPERTAYVPADPDAWVDAVDLAVIERRVFEVVIDPRATIEEMVVAGDYDYVNPNHTTVLFGRFRAVTGQTPVKAKVVAFRISRNVTTKQAKRFRARLGFGAIGIDHELAVGAQHKAAQRELCWIVNADFEVLMGGGRYVSVLYGCPDHRSLYLLGASHECHSGSWFLGLLSESV